MAALLSTFWRARKRLLPLALAAVLALGAGCGSEPNPLLAIENASAFPTRIARGPDGRVYVTDAAVGSVFIYRPNLTRMSEIRGFERPLGIAVAPDGLIYVGDDARDEIAVVDKNGLHLFSFGQGQIQMPSDLVFDRDGNLYVADSLNDAVRVYDRDGNHLLDISDPWLSFPSALAISYRYGYGELFVADQGNATVRVVDLDGNFVRAFGGRPNGADWDGKFVRIQSLALDAQDRLHVVCSFQHRVQILDADNGVFIDSYGSFGSEPGELNVPLDIDISAIGDVVVANSGNGRLEKIHRVWQP